ncbi:hypothetical protein NFI96_033155 [Prochilodus magdalenae]|nr:hypothetical protein NFI96_033155 [Prochilodus magdalenae]
MSRMSRILKGVQKELKFEKLCCAEFILSCLLAKFIAEGNPLHSTAVEDESSPEPDIRLKTAAHRKAGEDRVQMKAQDVTDTSKRPASVKKDQAKTKQKNDVRAEKKSSESKKDQKPSKKTQAGQNSQTRRLQTISENREEGRSRARAKSKVSEASVTEDQSNEGSPGDASPDVASAKRQRQPSLSSEELTDEDESFHPDSEKHKSSKVRPQKKSRLSSGHEQKGQKQKRKSSSGSSENENLHKKQKHKSVRNPIDLDIVLEAFQESVTQYKETLNSDSIKQAIDAFSCSFEEQLTEMITATKEFGDMRRKAAKMNSTLNHKKARLLEAKNELVMSEADVRKLQKEHDELEQRLKALRQGTTFLTNLKELKQRYLEYRIACPDEPETYGPSCMPAMLLEARSIMGTENQLKTINDKLQQVLEENGHKQN